MSDFIRFYIENSSLYKKYIHMCRSADVTSPEAIIIKSFNIFFRNAMVITVTQG